MPQQTKTILIFSAVVWNFYRTRPHEVALGLNAHGYRVQFVEPTRYPGATSMRFQETSQNAQSDVTVRSRKTRLHKGILLLLRENMHNVWLIIRHRPYAVIAGDVWMSGASALMCRIMRIPFFFDNMDYWPAVEKSRPMQWIVAHILYPLLGSLSTSVWNTSHFLQEHMQRYTKQSLYLPNAKSPQEIITYDQERTQLSAEALYHRVVFIATLRDWYDYDLLIDVFSQLPEIQLDIYGDGPMRSILEQKVGNHRNIRVYGPVASSDVARLTLHSDFGVLPLRNTAVSQGVFPIKLLDYWAARKPVIGTPVGELRILAQGEGLVTKQAAGEWLETIRTWYAHRDAMRTIGAHGYERLQSDFNYGILVQTLIEELEQAHS